MNLKDLIDKKGFIVTCELDPPNGPDLDSFIKKVDNLKDYVDAFNLTDNPTAKIKADNIAVANFAKSIFPNFYSIFHITCRDRNVLALHSRILGAYINKLENLLVITGDNPSIGDDPSAKPVFDMDAVGLVKLIKNLNNGETSKGIKLNGRTKFCIGVASNPSNPDLEKELDRLEEKIEAGADFVQTQPVYDIERYENYRAGLKLRDIKIPIIYGIMPLKSYKNVDFVSKIPGIYVPESIKQRLKYSDNDEGLLIAKETFDHLKNNGEKGIHIFPMGRVEDVKFLVEQKKKDYANTLPSFSPQSLSYVLSRLR